MKNRALHILTVLLLGCLCFVSSATAALIKQHPKTHLPVPEWHIGSYEEPPFGSNRRHATIMQGSVERYRYPRLVGFEAPVAITVGADGNIWLATDLDRGTIDKYVPGGGLTQYLIDREPIEIVNGPDKALWFTTSWPSIGRITTSGEVSEYALPVGSSPYGIVAGPDGALWFAMQDGNGGNGAIGRITTSGEIREYPLPSHKPNMALGLDPCCTQQWPTYITVGPEGDLWFTSPGNNTVGQITTAGQLIGEWAVPGIPDQIETIGSEVWVEEPESKATLSIQPQIGSCACKITGPVMATRPRRHRKHHRHHHACRRHHCKHHV